MVTALDYQVTTARWLVLGGGGGLGGDRKDCHWLRYVLD